MYYRHKNVIREMNWDKKIRSTSFVRCDNILEWVYFLSHYPPIEPSFRPQYVLGQQDFGAWCLLLLIHFKLVYGPFGQSNMHSTLDFCQPGRKQFCHYIREAKRLLSGPTEFTLLPTLNWRSHDK